jgi:hypothetical protein
MEEEEEEEEEEEALLEEEEEAEELGGVDNAAEDGPWSGKHRRRLRGSCFALEKWTKVSEEKPSTCESPSTMDSWSASRALQIPGMPFFSFCPPIHHHQPLT